jgi:hypothetical protein
MTMMLRRGLVRKLGDFSSFIADASSRRSLKTGANLTIFEFTTATLAL